MMLRLLSSHSVIILGRQMHAGLTPMMPVFLRVITLFAHSALCLFATIQFI
jgi:hypothetical protein